MKIAITDACCVINLHATGKLLSLLKTLGGEFYISAKVADETYYSLKWDEEFGENLVREAIDLAPAIEAGLLKRCEVSDGEETSLFILIAASVDDREATCLAIAKVRGWIVATDDRKAIRLAGELGVETISTPTLMKRWAEASGASDAEVANVLRSIQIFSHFVPRRTDPLYSWWIKRVGVGE